MIEWLCPGALVTCDTNGCDTVYEDRSRVEFGDLIEDLKNDGWKTKNEDGVWKHYCADCVDQRIIRRERHQEKGE